ncbi:deaminase reductase [Knoellia sinensis KCTC 19936]|uniref:Deaminase reductase n=1 Tax=Knoellia sinensis KCTC 19936 TaxID=1385520 RepID=A0A0A0J8I7_9MICO|nr:dihydrofolate reductase family protein [Knoellia sinensis]KGN33740.1 deaminase reductase [Knoellia sinensis KCTC 19936]
MGRLRYGMITSLDGYARDASGSFEWATPDDDLHAFVNDHERGVRTYVYGRGLWETMRYWQDPPAGDLTAPEHREFAALWQEIDKIIVSSTLSPPTEPRAELWPTLDLDRLATLVRESPTDVSIGGPTLAAAALEAGLVDEITAYVMPHIAGGGLPWLPSGLTTGLSLREQRAFRGGAVALIYDVSKG